MPYICFTGRGTDGRGNFVTRDSWERLARARGFTVLDRIPEYARADNMILIASQTGTVKARAAMNRSIPVRNYEWFDERSHLPASDMVYYAAVGEAQTFDAVVSKGFPKQDFAPESAPPKKRVRMMDLT